MSTIDDLYVQIGERIRLAREALGWTQAQLGEAVGFSQATVAHYELGRRHIRLDDLYRMASALNKPYAYFVGIDKQVEEETRINLEQQLRRDVADFVGVRMLPVLTHPIPLEDPLDPARAGTKIPVPRELAAQADCIYEVKAAGSGSGPGSGDFVFLARRSAPMPERIYLAQVGDDLAFLTRTNAGQYTTLAGEGLADGAPVIIGEFCGLYTQTLHLQVPAGPVSGTVPLWDQLGPDEQEQLQKFAQFLLAQRKA